MPHMPRPPSIDRGVTSLLWAVGLGAYIYFGSLAVGVSGGTAFIFAALSAFAIFVLPAPDAELARAAPAIADARNRNFADFIAPNIHR